MVPLAVKVVDRSETHRHTITGAYGHLPVYEYQDVNPGQIRLVDHFAGDAVRLWAAGDDNRTAACGNGDGYIDLILSRRLPRAAASGLLHARSCAAKGYRYWIRKPQFRPGLTIQTAISACNPTPPFRLNQR
jgi:hypothetical protein